MNSLISSLGLFFALILSSSCSSYIAQMHASMDRDMGIDRRAPVNQDHFDQFRRQPRGPQSLAQTSSQQANMAPSVQRRYRPVEDNTRRRVTANDLNDNDNSGSLWVNNGSPSNLYTSSKIHGHGDIILVDVYRKLRNEITLELQRAFPTPPSNTANGEQNTPEGRAAEANETATEDNKVYDRISTVVVEEVNRDHLLLRGRKYLIFQKRRRLVEVQALVSRRDITDLDSISSDSILESRVAVLR